ncbi:aminoglycoside phosphotransferase [Streptomyces vinaceus]|uniref:aminoglycoside phosphotransferase n=1 Tax=Streptomyces vinaceus TaxID=1960 RepID=UPI0038159FB1
MYAVTRRPYGELPEAALRAVEEQVGPSRCADLGPGDGSGVAALLWTDGPAGKVFVKGLPEDHERVPELEQEARVAPFLPAYAPRVLWQVSAGGWRLLGFEGLTVRPWSNFGTDNDADYLEPAAVILRDLSTRPAPAGALLPVAWNRWGHYLDDRHRELLQGETLVHGDPAATNFLPTPEGPSHLVDWGSSFRGPAWADAALWAFRIVTDGHQPFDVALDWARTIPAFTTAPVEGVRWLAEAEALAWQEHAADGDPVLVEIAAGARRWADFWAAQV